MQGGFRIKRIAVAGMSTHTQQTHGAHVSPVNGHGFGTHYYCVECMKGNSCRAIRPARAGGKSDDCLALLHNYVAGILLLDQQVHVVVLRLLSISHVSAWSLEVRTQARAKQHSRATAK